MILNHNSLATRHTIFAFHDTNFQAKIATKSNLVRVLFQSKASESFQASGKCRYSSLLSAGPEAIARRLAWNLCFCRRRPVACERNPRDAEQTEFAQGRKSQDARAYPGLFVFVAEIAGAERILVRPVSDSGGEIW